MTDTASPDALAALLSRFVDIFDADYFSERDRTHDFAVLREDIAALASLPAPAPDGLDAEHERLREALKDAIRILSGGHRGYVGDRWIRTVQVSEGSIQRLRDALDPQPRDGGEEAGRG